MPRKPNGTKKDSDPPVDDTPHVFGTRKFWTASTIKAPVYDHDHERQVVEMLDYYVEHRGDASGEPPLSDLGPDSVAAEPATGEPIPHSTAGQIRKNWKGNYKDKPIVTDSVDPFLILALAQKLAKGPIDNVGDTEE